VNAGRQLDWRRERGRGERSAPELMRETDGAGGATSVLEYHFKVIGRNWVRRGSHVPSRDGDNSKKFTVAVEPSAIRSDQSSETAIQYHVVTRRGLDGLDHPNVAARGRFPVGCFVRLGSCGLNERGAEALRKWQTALWPEHRELDGRSHLETHRAAGLERGWP
jgi:hypothetical protein